MKSENVKTARAAAAEVGDWGATAARLAGEDGVDLLGLLRAFRWATDDAERGQRAVVAELRAQGAPWSTVADALGVSRQAATKRFG